MMMLPTPPQSSSIIECPLNYPSSRKRENLRLNKEIKPRIDGKKKSVKFDGPLQIACT